MLLFDFLSSDAISPSNTNSHLYDTVHQELLTRMEPVDVAPYPQPSRTELNKPLFFIKGLALVIKL